MKYLSLLLLCVCLVGCDGGYEEYKITARKAKIERDARIDKENRIRLSEEGKEVGVLPDGRKVTKYYLDTGSSYPDVIYVVNGSITKNTKVQTSKNSLHNDIGVVIDEK
jgi:hypothetical protein